MLTLALTLLLASQPTTSPTTNPATQPANQPATRPAVQVFGDPMTIDAARTVAVGDLLADPAAFDGERVRVEGVVTGVCQPRGCWMRLGESAGAEETVFVKFTCDVDNRLIPLDAEGRTGQAEGVVVVEQISEADARHYAEDAGQSAEEVAAIVGPQTVVRMQGPSALVKD